MDNAAAHPSQDLVDLVDAATVHAASRGVVHALAPLAASPLDEHAAARMRQALTRATSPTVREALRRLVATPRPGIAGSRPPLAAVPDQPCSPTSGRPDDVRLGCSPLAEDVAEGVA